MTSAATALLLCISLGTHRVSTWARSAMELAISWHLHATLFSSDQHCFSLPVTLSELQVQSASLSFGGAHQRRG